MEPIGDFISSQIGLAHQKKIHEYLGTQSRALIFQLILYTEL